MGVISLLLIALAVGVLCSYVLYSRAKADNRNQWAWGLFGLVGNVFALMIYMFIERPRY